MNLADCYRLLGLRSGASFTDIKASYRRMARRYHPDANPGDLRAKEKFIQVTEAYKYLLEAIKSQENYRDVRQPPVKLEKQTQTGQTVQARTVGTQVKSPSVQVNPHLSANEQQLKQSSYNQLQQLLKAQRFPRAIALAEGLAQRIPNDPEVKQWQAIVYQRWGRQLIRERQFDKARTYLKKALRTDPHNRSLWAEVERDFRQMEQMF